jgi:hypothetical protein
MEYNQTEPVAVPKKRTLLERFIETIPTYSFVALPQKQSDLLTWIDKGNATSAR